MRVLVDTNILIRLAEPADPDHKTAVAAAAAVRAQGHELCLVPQNLYEFWAVSTRPAALGSPTLVRASRYGYPVWQLKH